MIKKIIKKRQLRDNSDYLDDLSYWLSRSPEERVAAVDFLRKQHHGHPERLQRSVRIVQQEQVIQLGVPPVRIDLLTSITGVTWEKAFSGKELGFYGDIPVHFLGKQEYIKNKRSTGRHKDLADLESLGES